MDVKLISNDLRSSCRALLLQAYDKGGGGGDDDEWKYPPDWIQIPKAAEDNTGYFLITLGSERTRGTFTVYGQEGHHAGVNIDWGDGTETTGTGTGWTNNGSVGHTFTHGSGHITDSGAEQFLITITVSDDDKVRSYGTGNYCVKTALSIHSGLLTTDDTIYTGINTSDMIYLALSGDVGALMKNRYIADTISLQKIDVTSSTLIDELFKFANSSSCVIKEKVVKPLIKDVEILTDNSFNSAYISDCTLHFPKLREMGNYCFRSLKGGWKIDAPMLEGCGASCFTSCNSLGEVRFSDNFDFDAARANGCFSGTSLL